MKHSNRSVGLPDENGQPPETVTLSTWDDDLPEDPNHHCYEPFGESCQPPESGVTRWQDAYEPMMDAPEAHAFNRALGEQQPIDDEVRSWLDSIPSDSGPVHLPEELRVRAAAASDRVQEAYTAYMKVIGE